jgi:hypothetical protein
MTKLILFTITCDAAGCKERVESEICIEDAHAEADRRFWQIDTIHGEGIEDRCPIHTEREV